MCPLCSPEWWTRSLALLLRPVAPDAPSMAQLGLAGTSACRQEVLRDAKLRSPTTMSLPGTHKLRLPEIA